QYLGSPGLQTLSKVGYSFTDCPYHEIHGYGQQKLALIGRNWTSGTKGRNIVEEEEVL
ncbi:unnamed protein product, partial [Allacma fusca]